MKLSEKVIAEVLAWYCMRVLVFTDGTGYAVGEIDHDEFFEGVLPAEGVQAWRDLIADDRSNTHRYDQRIKVLYRFTEAPE